ncbi:hypothetical protein BGZ47_001273 [Haplosporangium gracile]|nr:hypothetical protein BGZ47_001273 [Haplosporangium gracile]
MVDLKTFVLALSNTTVNKLTMNGGSFKNPTLDLVNRGRRFEPLMQLLFNDRIQFLHFKDFDDFFHHVGDPQVAMAPKLRYLLFSTGSVTKGKNSREVFAKVLRSAPSLTELRLSSQTLFEFALGQVSNNLRLTTLAWNGNGFSAEAHFRVGSIKAMMLKIEKLECLSSDGQRFALNGQLSGVRIDQTPRKADEALLRRMVQKNHDLSAVIIHSDHSRAVPLLDLLVSTRDEIFSAKKSCNLTIITVQDIRRKNGEPALYETSVKYTSDTTGERSVLSGLNMSESSNVDAIALADYLRLYGNTMEYIVASKAFTYRHAESLRNASSPYLQVLKLHPSLLRDTSLDAIDRYIEGSQVLKKLAFTSELMGNERQREIAVRLLSRHCQQVTSTTFIGEVSNPWLSQLSLVLPSRSKFPRLEELNILLADVTANDLQWMASMVSAQCPALGVGQAGLRRTCAPIRMFTLGGSPLKGKDWATLIKALDLTTLQTLIVQDRSFSTEQFRLLVEHIPNNVMIPLPLDNVAMWDREHSTEMDELMVQFHCKAPHAKLHFVLKPSLQ